MANTSDRLSLLFRDVTKMSEDELLEYTKAIRADRRTVKPSQKTKKKAVKKATKTKDDLLRMLKRLSPEDREAILSKGKK